VKIYYCKYKESYVVYFKEYVIRSAFQAIVDINGNTVGYEALARININESGEQVRPDVFFYLLMKRENYRNVLFMINRLHLLSYRKSKFFSKEKKLFLNLTPDFFERIMHFPYLIEEVNKIFKEFDITRSNVVAEITEGYAVCKKSLAIGTKLLSGNGYKLALDDYGDEASDFERYEMCKPEIVKISKNFFLSQKESGSYMEFKILIDKFKGNGSMVLVEGIELIDDYNMLLSLGIDYFQGFFFHKPECVSPCILVE